MDETYTEKTFILGIRAVRGVQSEVGLNRIIKYHLSIEPIAKPFKRDIFPLEPFPVAHFPSKRLFIS
jgi:hypothetical protein